MNINLVKFLLKLKNASLSKKEIILMDFNPYYLEVLSVLYKEGLIQSYYTEESENSKIVIKIFLRYFYNKPMLKNLKILSKPSHLKYMCYLDICKIIDKKFIFFFSTNKGLLTSLECKKKNIGGKLLFMC